MTGIYYLDRDVACEEDRDREAFIAEAVEYGLTVELIDEHGPGGGWPLYRFSSNNLTDVTDFIAYHYGEEAVTVQSYEGVNP